MDQRVTILSLHKLGRSKRSIANELQISRNTVKSIIKEHTPSSSELLVIPKIDRGSEIKKHHDLIKSWLLKEGELSSVRIWEKLKSEQNYHLGYDSVRRYLAKLRYKKDAYPVLETISGEEAQVDFGYIGYLIDPATNKRKKAYVFCMRLIYSRYDYYEIVFSQTVFSFLNCHINAFKYFGGVPKRIRIDNLGSAILNKDFYEPVYQRDYFSFSNYYDFGIEACHPSSPQEKSFVENGIRYVKRNFIAGRTFKDINDAKEQLKKWMVEKSERQHGTTRRKPIDMFLEEEKSKLKKLPINDYELSEWLTRKLHPDCYIKINNIYYSAPYKYIGEELAIRITQRVVEIHDNDLNIIALHKKGIREKTRIFNESHFPDWFKDITSRHYKDYYLKSISKHGETIFLYCKNITEKYQHSSYRMIQGIENLCKKYGKQLVEQACKRGIEFQNYSYMCIKNILTKNLIYNLEDIPIQENQKTSDNFKIDLRYYDSFLELN